MCRLRPFTTAGRSVEVRYRGCGQVVNAMKPLDDRNEYGVAMATIRARRGMSMAVFSRATGYSARAAWDRELGALFIDQSYLDNAASAIKLSPVEIGEVTVAVKQTRETRELNDAFRRRWREIPEPLLEQVKAVVLPPVV